MYLSGKVGSSPRISAPSAPPKPASPEPNAKVMPNTAPTLMPSPRATRWSSTAARKRLPKRVFARINCKATVNSPRSEERRVGKECRSRGAPEQEKKKKAEEKKRIRRRMRREETKETIQEE